MRRLVGVQTDALGIPVLVSGNKQTVSDGLLIGVGEESRDSREICCANKLSAHEKIHESHRSRIAVEISWALNGRFDADRGVRRSQRLHEFTEYLVCSLS